MADKAAFQVIVLVSSRLQFSSMLLYYEIYKKYSIGFHSESLSLPGNCIILHQVGTFVEREKKSILAVRITQLVSASGM